MRYGDSGGAYDDVVGGPRDGPGAPVFCCIPVATERIDPVDHGQNSILELLQARRPTPSTQLCGPFGPCCPDPVSKPCPDSLDEFHVSAPWTSLRTKAVTTDSLQCFQIDSTAARNLSAR